MPTERRPTMRDVAAAAEVSFKTVSRVVNLEGGVRPELVARVQAAIAELGYRPDHRARGLRKSDAQPLAIGIVLVDIANPFSSNVFRGIEEVAVTRGCLVLAGSTDGSAKRQRQLIETLVGRRVDGLIVVPTGAELGPLESEISRGTPVVFIDVDPEIGPVDLVRSDHLAGAETLAQHLLDHGHTDIVYFGDDPRIFSARLRLRGFRSTMAAAGIDLPDHRIVTGTYDAKEWQQIVLDHLTTHPLPTAVLSAQNFATVGAIRALHELGLHRSISQVGFDDVDLGDLVEPGITVVCQRPRDLGRRAAKLLFGRLDGDGDRPHVQIVPVPLITRGSGEIQPSPAGGADG